MVERSKNENLVIFTLSGNPINTLVCLTRPFQVSKMILLKLANNFSFVSENMIMIPSLSSWYDHYDPFKSQLNGGSIVFQVRSL